MDRSQIKDASGVYRLSYSLLAVFLLVTAGATLTFYKNAAERDAVKFTGTASRMQTEIENKVNLYITLIAGVRGFISTTPNLDRNRFAAYVESLHLESNYPALLRVGYVQTVASSELTEYREKMRRAGYPDVNVFPSAERSEYQLVTFIGPQSKSSPRVIGFDMAADPDRQAPLELAANSGAAAMSGRLKPMIERSPEGDVIAIFLPVYAEGEDAPIDAPAGKQPVGFVYTSFTPQGFLTDIEKVQVDKDVAIHLFDGSEIDANLLAETSQVQPVLPSILSMGQSLRSELTVAGRSWVTRFNSLPAFTAHSAVGWTPVLFFAGTCFSFLVFGFTYNDASRRAELQKLTGQLLETQKEKQSLFEQEKRARLEAEEANRTKDEFLAIMSHELKTPLNTIAGWTSILRSDHLTPGTKDTALRKIEKNLRLQATMVEQILSFSRLMSDGVPTTFSAVPASEVFANATAAAQDSAAEKMIVFRSANELRDEMIDADAERITLALSNILANAFKFTQSGGKVEARAYAHNGDVRFVVKDNGSGIEPDFLPHVFDQYRQGDKPAVRSYGGLGLGLAITKHIVEMHGGTVESASPGLGRGADFTISLPVKPQSKTYDNNT
ncbi:MAG: CHASE domain-containing protein [Acidobacteriota bacterium]